MRSPSALKLLKYALKLAVLRRTPRLYWGLRTLLRGPLEPEMGFVPAFADRARIAVDVGANFGAWSTLLASQFATCHAFEPQPRLASALLAGAPPNLHVHCCALSDRPGRVRLRVPRLNLGRSTIDAQNVLGELDPQPIGEVEVLCARLDDLGFADSVAFIKIDVEGHELSVLRGAELLLRASRPVVLVETEERHHPGAPAEIRTIFQALAYHELPLRGRNLLFVP